MDLSPLALLDSAILGSIFVLAKDPAGNLAPFRLICKTIGNIIDLNITVLFFNGDLPRILPFIPSSLVLPNINTLQLRISLPRTFEMVVEICDLIRLDGRFRHLRLFFPTLASDAADALSHAIAACKAPLQEVAIYLQNYVRFHHRDGNGFRTAVADVIMRAHPGLLHLPGAAAARWSCSMVAGVPSWPPHLQDARVGLRYHSPSNRGAAQLQQPAGAPAR